MQVHRQKLRLNRFQRIFSISDFENLKKLNGDIIAFDGTIKQEKLSRNNTPFYYLELEKKKEFGQLLCLKMIKTKLETKLELWVI